MGFFGSLISNVGDLFGGASNNAGFTAQSAPLIQPVVGQQLSNAANTTTGGINQQQDLINALAGQGQQGINSQSLLTQQLINQANGQGPNPAQAALAQNTGQNINNQAALAAGQRGASGNVGLIQRQNAQQGAGIQQNAVGQAATLQAQQQLAAQQQLQQLAGTQIGQQSGAINNLNNASLTNQGQLLGALQGYNSALVGNVGSQNSANASLAQANANNSNKLLSGGINGLAGAAQGPLGSLFSGGAGAGFGSGQSLADFAAATGEDEGASALAAATLAKGGEVDANSILAKVLSKKQMPDHMQAMAQIYHPKMMADGGEMNSAENATQLKEDLSLSSLEANKGAVVPGNPKVPGKNTLKNDVVPAMLTPKEIVLPLSVTQAKDPGEAAKAFVEHIKGKDSERKSEEKSGDFKEALKKHISNRKNKKK